MGPTSMPSSTYEMVLCGLFFTGLAMYIAYIIWELHNPHKRKPGLMDEDDDFLISLSKFGSFS